MAQTVMFTKVFKAEGTSARGPWTRWDYKTEDGGRFPHFAGTQEIPLDTLVQVQTSAKGDIKSWQVAPIQSEAAGDSLPAENQQASSGSSGLQSHVRTAPVTPEGHPGPDWDAIARGKVKSLLWANLLPAMFQSLPKAEQTVENAGHLVHHAMTEVFPDDPPF